jgi:hypothetical protein
MQETCVSRVCKRIWCTFCSCLGQIATRFLCFAVYQQNMAKFLSRVDTRKRVHMVDFRMTKGFFHVFFTSIWKMPLWSVFWRCTTQKSDLTVSYGLLDGLPCTEIKHIVKFQIISCSRVAYAKAMPRVPLLRCVSIETAHNVCPLG